MAPYLAALRKAWCSQTLPRLRHRLAHHLSTAPHPFPAALVVPESAKVGHAALKIRKLPLETSASSSSSEGLASPRTTAFSGEEDEEDELLSSGSRVDDETGELDGSSGPGTLQ